MHSSHQITSLRDKQDESLAAAKDHDVISVLPTGYGKTIIIQLLPFLRQDKDCIVVIISPLNTIIHEQAARFGQHGQIIDGDFINDLVSGVAQEKVSKIVDGQVLYLLGHPEKITCYEIKKLLMPDTMAKQVRWLSKKPEELYIFCCPLLEFGFQFKQFILNVCLTRIFRHLSSISMFPFFFFFLGGGGL